MKRMRKFDRWWPVFFVALAASVRLVWAQPPQPAGLETPWDARQMLADLDKDNEQLKPLLEEMNPQAWYDQKGASSTYIIQWHTAQTEVNDVIAVAKALGKIRRTCRRRWTFISGWRRWILRHVRWRRARISMAHELRRIN